MRAGPLSSPEVIDLLNRRFVPVYAVNETDEGTRFECTATEFLFRQMTDPGFRFYSHAEHITGHWFMEFIR